MPKHITAQNMIGAQGINLIERIVLNMGYMWYPTGSVEAGIDGWIEIRDPATGEVRNAMVPVQSKATLARFLDAAERPLEFRCKDNDLTYWLGGTGEVILIYSLPNIEEAYWVPLKQYFADHREDLARKVVRFDKEKDKFSTNSAAALESLALPREAGVYFGLRPKTEQLWSNVLPISLPPDMWLARSLHRDPADLWRALRAASASPPGAWALCGPVILSFRDLDDPPWDQVCERGTAERFSTSEWADSDDPDQQRDFVHLLNRTLTNALAPSMRYDRDKKLHYIVATPDLSPLTYSYQSRVEGATRTIFQGYPRSDGSGMSYYRHGAFAGRFRRLDAAWYLEIVPSYVFTRDGWQPSLYSSTLLAKIKRLERNDAVCAQVLMWASYVAQTLAKGETPTLAIGSIVTFDVEAGLDDELWRHSDETFPPLEAAVAEDERSDGEDKQPAVEKKTGHTRGRKSPSRETVDERAAGATENQPELDGQLALFQAPKTKYRWHARRSRGAVREDG